MTSFTRKDLKERIQKVEGMNALQADKPFQTSYGTIMKVAKAMGAEMANCGISISKKELKGEGIIMGAEVQVQTVVKMGSQTSTFSLFYTRILDSDNRVINKLEWQGDKEKERTRYQNMTTLQNMVLGF